MISVLNMRFGSECEEKVPVNPMALAIINQISNRSKAYSKFQTRNSHSRFKIFNFKPQLSFGGKMSFCSDVGGQHCPCLVFVRIFRRILSGVYRLSGLCPDSLSGVCLSGFCLSHFCPLSGFCPEFCKKTYPMSVCPNSVCLDFVRCPDFVRNSKKLSVVCLSGRTKTRQSCPDFRCPCPPTFASGVVKNTLVVRCNTVT